VIDDGVNSIVVDPGQISTETAVRIVNGSSPIIAILLTHGHFDHFAGIPKIVEASNLLPIFISEIDFQNISINKLLKFLVESQSDTPGHTDGSVCFLQSGTLFSGDTLLARKRGPTYWPDANSSKLENSMKRLQAIDFIDVLPGHGRSFTKNDISWDSYEH
jgi:hydroxyacylglutathione hydrolase